MAATALAVALSAQVAMAQDAGQKPSEPAGRSTPASTARQAGMNSATDIRYSQWRDAAVKSETGQDLGKLDNVLIDPQTGQIQFVVLGRGGFLGLGEKLVPVPWHAVLSASNKQITLNVTPQKLHSAPTLEKNYANLSDPGFLAQVDQYYSTTPSAAGAAGEAGGGSQSGSGQR